MKYKRPYLLSWIIIPAIALLATANYLYGTINKPVWDNASAMNPNVLGYANTASIDPPPVPEIDVAKVTSRGAVSIWFDDAWSSEFTHAYPLMEKYGFKGALAVPTHLVGYPAYMDWNQVKSLQHRGWEIGAHTRTHTCDITKYDQPFIFDQLLGSKQDLMAQGLRADNYVSPCGVINTQISDFAKKIFFSLRTSDPGVNNLPLDNPYELKSYIVRNTTTLTDILDWLREAKQERAWLILTFHQIEDNAEGEFTITPDFLDKILSEVLESELPVVLPAQIVSQRIGQ